MVLSKMKAAVAAFFDLPLEEKKKHSMAENDLQGYGQAYVVSEQQKLDWGDLFFLITCPLEDRNMKYLPTTYPGFRYVMKYIYTSLITYSPHSITVCDRQKKLDRYTFKKLF